MTESDWRMALRDGAVVQVKRKRDQRKGEAAEGNGAAEEKRGPKYSPGLMSLLGMAERRIAAGLAEGAAEYLRLSQKAAAGAPDGAVLGAAKNLMRAQEKIVKQAAKMPRDLTKGREFQRASKRARKITRLMEW